MQRLSDAAGLTLACLGKVAGLHTMAEAIAEPSLAKLVTDMLVREIMPDFDIPEADRALVASNVLNALSTDKSPIENHAANASQRLEDALLTPARARIQLGEPVIRITLAVAGWIDFAGGIDDAGAEYDYEDPMIGRLLFLSAQSRTNPDALATAFLSLDAVFDVDLPNVILFRAQMTQHLSHLLHQGVLPTVQMVVNGPEVMA